MLVATAAAEVPEAVRQESSLMDCRNHLGCAAQASLPVGEPRRADGLVFRLRRTNPSKANISKAASEARSPASESLNYQLRKIIKPAPLPLRQAVVKLLWVAIRDIEDKRARPRAKPPRTYVPGRLV